MKYRVRLDAALDVTDALTRDQIREFLTSVRNKMQRVNSFETSSIVVEECHHDESPPRPCVELYRWEKA